MSEKEPWICSRCGQKNSAWAKQCGRCEDHLREPLAAEEMVTEPDPSEYGVTKYGEAQWKWDHADQPRALKFFIAQHYYERVTAARRIAELENENANWKQLHENDEACIATLRAAAEPRAVQRQSAQILRKTATRHFVVAIPSGTR